MGGSNQKADEPITEINVTPLVDVCLVLVIIFMAVAPFALTLGINVLQSKAKAAEGKASLDENVQVKLTQDGTITVNGVATKFEDLNGRIVSGLARSKDKMVTVTADETNRVGQVVEILDMAKQAGAAKVAILKSTEEKPAGT